MCIAFSSDREGPFVNGYAVSLTEFKNLYRVLEDHETSKIHENAAKSYLVACKNVDDR